MRTILFSIACILSFISIISCSSDTDDGYNNLGGLVEEKTPELTEIEIPASGGNYLFANKQDGPISSITMKEGDGEETYLMGDPYSYIPGRADQHIPGACGYLSANYSFYQSLKEGKRQVICRLGKNTTGKTRKFKFQLSYANYGYKLIITQPAAE